MHLEIHSQGRVLGMRTLPVADMQVRHLKTLGMEQVAAAIRTHGTGLADNAVNVTYQFLARKITMLSQVGSPLLVSHALSSRDDEQLQIQGTVPWLVTMTVSALLHLSKVPNELFGGAAQNAAKPTCLVVQFLLQDAVRARLSKEAFDFGESRAAGSNAPYAMGAAQRLTADFGRLGSAPDGLPYLDHLRHLITGEPSGSQPS